MITIGSLYAMAPRALDRPAMHSQAAMELHFWLHTIGPAAVRALDVGRGHHRGPDVARDRIRTARSPTLSSTSLIAIKPFYVVRFLGGVLVLSGMVVMAWNLWHTAADARAGIDQADPGADRPSRFRSRCPHQVPAPLPARA